MVLIVSRKRRDNEWGLARCYRRSGGSPLSSSAAYEAARGLGSPDMMFQASELVHDQLCVVRCALFYEQLAAEVYSRLPTANL